MEITIPKYYALKNYILDMIDNEEFVMSKAITSERVLTTQFGISRITVRRAIEELVNEGVLYRVQGKGTYVKKADFKQNFFMINSCTEDIIKQNMTPTRKILQLEIRDCTPLQARLLEISPEEKVFILERIYYADGVPINCTLTALPYHRFPGIEKYNFEENSLYKILEQEYSVTITKATRSLDACLALEDTAEKLDLHLGAPLLYFKAITYGKIKGKEIPIEAFKTYFRTDHFKFYIHQANESK